MIRDLIRDVVPDGRQLATIFAQSVAPAFLLGAVAAFVSLLMARLKNIVDRLGQLQRMTDDSPGARFKKDIPQLKHRAVLLSTATHLALGAGICTTLLLMISFASAMFRFQHIYGGALLFALANVFLMCALYKFAQEVRAELKEIHQI